MKLRSCRRLDEIEAGVCAPARFHPKENCIFLALLCSYLFAEELLADKYYEGAYIVKDVKAAIYWYEKAANQGSVYAMYQAGYVYYTVPIDYNKAGQWFSLAAEKGNKDAEDVLRNHLRYNRFTKKWDAIR